MKSTNDTFSHSGISTKNTLFHQENYITPLLGFLGCNFIVLDTLSQETGVVSIITPVFTPLRYMASSTLRSIDKERQQVISVSICIVEATNRLGSSAAYYQAQN